MPGVNGQGFGLIMKNTKLLIRDIISGAYDETIKKLYNADEKELVFQKNRYIKAVENFELVFGADREVALYSAPGRTEIIGNHTDHNNGLAMGAAVNLDIIAVVALNDSGMIRVKSQGYDKMDIVDVSNIEPVKEERGKSAALIRGMAAGFVKNGGFAGGFDAYTTSRVLSGSGLSSSAAFEMCLGAIINREFNNAKFEAAEIALIGQLSENVYFGKPTGVLDQISCVYGGAVMIDFKDSHSPKVKAMPLDLDAFGYKMVITDTKGSHANLTDDYAAIRNEMESVAELFEKKVLRELNEEEFRDNIPEAREKCGDRAVLRALHFYNECRRVKELSVAIENKDINKHLSLVLESGHSSFEYNQNAFSSKDADNQGVSVGLAFSQEVLAGRGAWRLQGGGFAGTIQAYVPFDLLDKYVRTLESVFGKDSCHIITVRNYGGVCVDCDGLL